MGCWNADLRILWPRNSSGNAWWGGGVLECRFKDSVAVCLPLHVYLNAHVMVRESARPAEKAFLDTGHACNMYLQSPCRSLLALPSCGGLQRAHASPQLLLHDARCRVIFKEINREQMLLFQKINRENAKCLKELN